MQITCNSADDDMVRHAALSSEMVKQLTDAHTNTSIGTYTDVDTNTDTDANIDADTDTDTDTCTDADTDIGTDTEIHADTDKDIDTVADTVIDTNRNTRTHSHSHLLQFPLHVQRVQEMPRVGWRDRVIANAGVLMILFLCRCQRATNW